MKDITNNKLIVKSLMKALGRVNKIQKGTSDPQEHGQNEKRIKPIMM